MFMPPASEFGLPNRLGEVMDERNFTMEKLAEKVGSHWTTIAKLKSGKLPMSDRWLRRLADAMGLDDPLDIMRAPNAPSMVPVKGYVGAGAEVYPIEDTSERIDEVEVAAKVPHSVAALLVRGNSMYPVYEDRDTIFFRETGESPRELIGREVIVRLTDGRTFIKRLRRGSNARQFSLESYNSPPIEDVEIEWAAPTWNPVRDALRRKTD